MDKTPVKKVKMMDIVRKRPTVTPIARKEEVTEAPREPKEEQVKFSIEKRLTAEQVRASIDEREAKRERMEALVAQEKASSKRIVEPVHVAEPRVELRPTAEEIQAALHEQEPKEEVHHAEPRILEMHTGHEQSRMAEEKSHESDRMIPEVSSMEMDRPIAYIPKEKTSREEKKVLERIERRERYYEKEGGSPKKKRGVFTWIVSCLLLGVIAYIAITVLPRAEIILTPKLLTPPPYANPITGSTKIAEVDPIKRQIPVAVFAEKKTNAFQFPATGSGKNIERKATGKVTVYNDFSGSQQPLLAGTRLETPDGKIFKLKDRIVVPGAATVDGKLAAASIVADVIAEKAGEVYNISPVDKFTIPGFKGTTKYDGFYAESKDSMTGGFIGEGKYPTAGDIKAGKESAETQMKGLLDTFLATQVVPEGFKSIDSSKKYSITKEVVNEGVDDQGNFSIYIEAEGTVDALKEEHVLKLMTALQTPTGEGYELRQHDPISYGEMTVNEKTGEVSLPIEFKGIYWRPINVDEFKRNVIGKTEDALKSYVISSTNISKADVALWPFWVKTVPSDPSRVKVELK
jgi:hypothetical protein